jgi:hypothetical protein
VLKEQKQRWKRKDVNWNNNIAVNLLKIFQISNGMPSF